MGVGLPSCAKLFMYELNLKVTSFFVQVPLTDEEIEELIAEFLEVESKVYLSLS